jgi:hypothetical protein
LSLHAGVSTTIFSPMKQAFLSSYFDTSTRYPDKRRITTTMAV